MAIGSSDFNNGLTVMVTVQAFADLVLILRARARASKSTAPADDAQRPIRFEQAVAGAIAYGFYVAAAMMAGARFPEFLRDHLFDGFAPAALVAYLIYRLANTRAKFSTIAGLYLLSAAVFGLIAAAAVFSLDKNDYLPPVLSAAVIGGITLAIAGATTSDAAAETEQRTDFEQLRAEQRADFDQQQAKLDQLRADAKTDQQRTELDQLQVELDQLRAKADARVTSALDHAGTPARPSPDGG